jgi:outer membrane murein-binding lipoprotein Lpp
MGNENITVSQAEIDAVEKEVNEKLASETKTKNEGLAKQIRSEVETEFKRKAEIQKLQDDLAKQQQEIKKAQEEATKAKEEADKKVKDLESSFRKELEDLSATRKGIVAQNISPFTPTQMNPNVKVVNGKQIDLTDKPTMDAIEEESRLALMRAWGIDPNLNPEWGRDPTKNR